MAKKQNNGSKTGRPSLKKPSLKADSQLSMARRSVYVLTVGDIRILNLTIVKNEVRVEIIAEAI